MRKKKEEFQYDFGIMLALPVGYNPDERVIAQDVECDFCRKDLWLSVTKKETVDMFEKEGKGIYILCAECISGWHKETFDESNSKRFDVEDIEGYGKKVIKQLSDATKLKQDKT